MQTTPNHPTSTATTDVLLSRMLQAIENLAESQKAMGERQDRTLQAVEKLGERQDRTLQAVEKLGERQDRTLQAVEKLGERLELRLEKQDETLNLLRESIVAQQRTPLSASRGTAWMSPPDFPTSTYSVRPRKAALMPSYYDAALYRRLATRWRDRLVHFQLYGLLEMLGNDWFEEWMEIYGRTTQEDLDRILAQVPKPSSPGEPWTEKTHQRVFGDLVKAVEVQLVGNGARAGLKWVDTHKTSLENRRKPDGIFARADAPAGKLAWRDVVAVCEFKGSRAQRDDSVLIGQLIQDFTNVAASQPRRFMLGMSVVAQGDVYVHLCTIDRIYYSFVGKLPRLASAGTTSGQKPPRPAHSNEGRAVMCFLQLLYKQLGQDRGYLAQGPEGLSEDIRLRDLPLASVEIDENDYQNATIKLLNDCPIGGRRGQLFGSRSWIYEAAVVHSSGNNNIMLAVLKIHWCRGEGASEIRAHRKVLQLGLPYVPQLRFAGIIKNNSDLRGEVLLIEDAGINIGYYFMRPESIHKLIDVFAGYIDLILEGTAGIGGTSVMHRDISMANLLVANDKPRVIDWGCGIAYPSSHDGSPPPLGQSVTGTTPYMSVRTLCQQDKHSYVDDLESVFLVYSHCLCLKYGNRASQWCKGMWDGSSELSCLLDKRKVWLESQNTYMREMDLKRCPDALSSLAVRLYELLFDPNLYGQLDNLAKRPDDPRLTHLTAAKWADAIHSVTKDIAPEGPMPCLDRLRSFASSSSLPTGPVSAADGA
ncbi:hypothetical protein EV182_000586 [Spiromyces aspiralis]|uniref:Uncharacterized protein n=1 Tax=Spiromyces aspiralis TaxID=68401 RepID=A0ACC1HGU0_9FUNG|nr:hypothetical protein EV182_000586 [Spiromyces aspiralis]